MFLADVTRARPALTYGNEGKVTGRTYVETPLKACVQQAGANDVIDIAPEGERLGNWIIVYSQAAILATNAKDTESDLVKWSGGSYRVVKVEHWETYGYYVTYCKGFIPAPATVVTP